MAEPGRNISTRCTMTDYLKDYCYYFLDRLESKFKFYLGLLEGDSVSANRTTSGGRALFAVAETIPTVGPMCKNATQELSNRWDKATAKNLRKLVYNHDRNKEASQKLYLSVAYELFACFEKQFSQVTCKDDPTSIRKLAYDAVKRFKSGILKITSPTSPSCQKAVIEWIVKNQEHRWRNPIKTRRTVKTQPQEGSEVKTWKCKDIYTKVGVYHADNKTLYSNKQTQIDEFGFRLAFTFETLTILAETYDPLGEETNGDILSSYTFLPHNFKLYYPEINQYLRKKKGTEDNEVAASMKTKDQPKKYDKSLENTNTALVNKGLTPLMGAAANGHLKIVAHSISKEVDVNAADNDGNTALIYAAANGYLEIVNALIEEDAHVNAGDNEGLTSLICAAANGHLDVVKKLLEHAANANAVNNEGQTSLICGARNGYFEIVEKLLEHNADVNACDNEGLTSLICAANNSDLEIIEKLLEHDDPVVNVNAVDNEGQTALICAVINGNLEIVVKLLEHDAEVNVTMNGWSPLLIASTKGFNEIYEKLCKYGADPN